MSSPSIDQDKELAEFFTDVEHLRGAFKDAVAASVLTKRLFIVHGVGGVGKSSLLRMFRLHCKGVNVPVALASGDEAKSAFDILSRWTDDLKASGVAFSAFSKTFAHYRDIQAKVDAQAKKAGGRAADIAGKAASKTAEAAGGALAGAAIGSIIPGVGTAIGGALGGVLGGMGAEALTDWLRGFLKQPDIDLLLDPAKKLTDDFLSDIAKAADKRRSVLLLDTFEQMTALEDWTREFAQRLNPNALFVIAGRGLPSWGRTWDSWQKHAYVEELKPMTEDVMRELIQRYYATMRGGEPDPAQVEAIIRFARGLPMVVTSAVQLWVKYGVEDFQSVKAEIVANLVDRLMEGVPSTLIPALEAAAVVRWFDQPILRSVMLQNDVYDAYNELRRFPFVRVRVEGLALHDAVREIMDENLHVQDIEKYHELHQRAAGYFENRLQKVISEEQERLEIEQLYHCLRVDEPSATLLFRRMAENLAQYRFSSRLRALLTEVDSFPFMTADGQWWCQYYKARSKYLQGDLAEAIHIFETIRGATTVGRLRAETAADLGLILARTSWLTQPHGQTKAIAMLTESLAALPFNHPKYILSLLGLCSVYTRAGNYEEALHYGDEAYNLAVDSQDTYMQIQCLERLRRIQVLRGDWLSMRDGCRESEKILQTQPESKYLVSRALGGFAIGWAWAGDYSECKRRARIAVNALESLGDAGMTGYQRDIAYACGMQGDYDVAVNMFRVIVETAHRLGRGRETHTLRRWGEVLTRQGRFEEARDLLISSFPTNAGIYGENETIECFVLVAGLEETQGNLAEAEKQNRHSLDLNKGRRKYFESAALCNLLRIQHKHAIDTQMPRFGDIERIAHQYEYNDHLASLRLTQGHVSWEGKAPTWGNGVEAALYFYQHALIYALRYNRFLLDEVLSGRPQGSPLRPIIPQCLESGEEGRQMLSALLDWWKTGVNDIGTPRPDTISPIPEGMPLLEAEHLAREREPGDGSPQKSVIEQIEAALG